MRFYRKVEDNRTARARGFTLIELLVVISIIALLMAVMMPSLQKARYHAKRVICMTNIRSQALVQFEYACDNDGRFVKHDSHGPNYARSLIGDTELFDQLNGSYMSDPKIMICPELRRLGGSFDERFYISSGGVEYAGWDIGQWKKKQDVDPIAFISSSYMWYANFHAAPNDTYVRYLNNEPRFPRRDSDCNASKAFISHEVSGSNMNQITWDLGHGSTENLLVIDAVDFDKIKSKDNPVCYADGHIEWRTVREMKPRIRFIHGGPYVLWY